MFSTRFAYADHKDLINRTEADKVLRDKAYDIASNPEYGGYQRSLVSMVYKFFDKKSTAGPSALASSSLERTGSGFKKLKNTTKSTAKPSALARNSSMLADEGHKPIIRKLNKRKVYSQFKDNIWGVDLADMQSLSRKNKGINIDIEVGSIKKLNTVICISLPESSYGFIIDKSSLASKGLLTLGKVINKDYTGEIIVIMTSLIDPIKIK